MKPQGIAVLGATGSIGVNTLDVVARHPDRYRWWLLAVIVRWIACLSRRVVFFPLCCGGRCSRCQCPARPLREQGLATEVLHGAAALERVAALPEVDVVMAAIVGAAGLPSAMAAARAGKKILLANKESLVVAGRLFMETVREHGATLLPVDSEHNAIFQSLPHDYAGNLDASGIRKIILTASGGRFASTVPKPCCRSRRKMPVVIPTG
jgi:1-deoxy-D-xylulose-5-phosphate reductoisomerase